MRLEAPEQRDSGTQAMLLESCLHGQREPVSGGFLWRVPVEGSCGTAAPQRTHITERPLLSLIACSLLVGGYSVECRMYLNGIEMRRKRARRDGSGAARPRRSSNQEKKMPLHVYGCRRTAQGAGIPGVQLAGLCAPQPGYTKAACWQAGWPPCCHRIGQELKQYIRTSQHGQRPAETCWMQMSADGRGHDSLA